jgi:hypothetical protein
VKGAFKVGQDKLHFHSDRLIRLLEERRSLEEKILQEKQIVDRIMWESGENIVRYPFSDTHDIKVERGVNRQTKLDKEAIADELDLTVENVKPEVIMKKIDERKYSFDQYKKNKYADEQVKTSVRLVKVEKEKKNKKK